MLSSERLLLVVVTGNFTFISHVNDKVHLYRLINRSLRRNTHAIQDTCQVNSQILFLSSRAFITEKRDDVHS